MNEDPVSEARNSGISPRLFAQRIKAVLWDKEIAISRLRLPVVLVASLIGLALFLELGFHAQGFYIGDALSAKQISTFANVASLNISSFDPVLVGALVAATVLRVVFGIAVGIADVVFYKRITGQDFDYDAMVNLAIVNMIFLLTAIFTFMNPWFMALLEHYQTWVERIPTVVETHGVVAIALACLIGDFCFYWSHRWCHKLRFFWTLGHINHHRSHKLTQVTQAMDPQAFLLDTAGGKVFALLLLPPLVKLFASDLSTGGWALVVVLLIDTWLNPSHSTTLYYIELRSRYLRALRWIFVMPGVHFTHHSREAHMNISDGCNFGARFTLWDRLFKTYCEPPPYIPEAGLFSEKADYIRTPLRFIVHPYVKLYLELKGNRLGHWPKIMFGPTSYNPPNKVNMES